MKTALLLVDIQNDFCPGGALPVTEGDQVVGPANKLIQHFEKYHMPIIFTRDWHPVNHSSFKEFGGIWPSHCVADTSGAAFHKDLHVPQNPKIVSKATTPENEAYSGFEGTNLAQYLRQQNVDSVIVLGLATDYCVKNTVQDALNEGFKVTVVPEGIRAVNVQPEDGEKAIKKMQEKGAGFVNLETVLHAGL